MNMYHSKAVKKSSKVIFKSVNNWLMLFRSVGHGPLLILDIGWYAIPVQPSHICPDDRFGFWELVRPDLSS
jgi:hypothetical protein